MLPRMPSGGTARTQHLVHSVFVQDAIQEEGPQGGVFLVFLGLHVRRSRRVDPHRIPDGGRIDRILKQYVANPIHRIRLLLFGAIGM
jgi:hypothetical protein